MASIKHKSQEKYINIISDLLKREDNKYCVDCGSRGPRWASCTLGVFLCIQCAIIHRNMGVHLSRIKSVDYDNWTSQQVDTMVKIGNSRGRAIYEANLGNNFLRPQNKCELDKFIRSKYEHKLYVKKEQISPTATPKERKLKQNPNDKKVNSKMILSKQENIVTPISVKIIKEHDAGSATKQLTVSSSASSNNIDRVTNSSTLSNNNVPTNNLMNPRNNYVLTSQPEIPQKSDNVVAVADDYDDDDEFTEFISAAQPLEVSCSETNITNNDVDVVFNSSNNNASTCQNNLSNFNSELERYAMNRNMAHGQMTANNVFGVQCHQFTENSQFGTQASMPMLQESDDATNNVDDFPELISARQPPISNYQTSHGSATQSFTENSGVNAIGSVPNSTTLSSINAPIYQNNLVQFNFQLEGYAMNENNFMIHEQLFTNSASGIPWNQSINNYVFPGQPVIPISQVNQYNLLQISSLENRDSNVHVPIPESGNEFSTAYPETGTDNYLEFLENIEMTEIFQILIL